MAPDAGAAVDADNRRAWQETLDTMQRNLECLSAAVAAGDIPEIVAPRRLGGSGFGPLPADMLDDALDLVNRQEEVAAQIRQSMVRLAQKIHAIRDLRVRVAKSPHYIDKEG
ncbi:MAG: hypothetical protein LKK54_03775 [Ancrocorticia sp.]|jgi:hypothetical protein|nr:hypothetical protein [Ancrocorticia sp.]MCI2178355.1 hypothetical protein [Ancrocorticia sp.]MCI2193161.1 hypothetical protein [Ancrocorticia sp.]MCI2198839.1 hypothetical protein [Ancrocorticia sp.]